MGCGKSSSKSEVHSDTGLSQFKKVYKINNLTLHLKELVGRTKLAEEKK